MIGQRVVAGGTLLVPLGERLQLSFADLHLVLDCLQIGQNLRLRVLLHVLCCGRHLLYLLLEFVHVPLQLRHFGHLALTGRGRATISGSLVRRPFICDSMVSPQSCASTCTFIDRLERKESKSSALPINSTDAFTQSAASKAVLSKSDEFSKLMLCAVFVEKCG